MKKLTLAIVIILTTFSCNKKLTEKESQLDTSKTDQKEVVDSQSLEGKKYKLVELNGKKIDAKKNDFFIEFNKDGRFSAFAGCNNMAGEYKVENTFRIKFSKVLSTMMACDDMATEKELAEVLELTDNLSINENSLSLNKARMAPLARFELIK